MCLPIQLISTDFDGTLFAEFENPPVPQKLQSLLTDLQSRGAKWVVNTGRDLPSLMEGLGRGHLSVKPDFLVLVEREIYIRQGSQYVEHSEWNRRCAQIHADLFARVEADLPRLTAWIQDRFDALIYEDSYSPFCFIADHLEDAEKIHNYLNDYCKQVPNLMVMRNDVYARFCHKAYHKGSALAEIERLSGVGKDHTFASGDHLNDLPMLSSEYARYLVVPNNAIDAVKTAIREHQGYISPFNCGLGVADGLEHFLQPNSVT